MVPMSTEELYSDAPRLVNSVQGAAEHAAALGARAISLTGHIPSALGADGLDALQRSCPVAITTGARTTAAAVVLALRALLSVAGRSFSDERVALVGLGRIGGTVVDLVLDSVGLPRTVTLADIYNRAHALRAIEQRLRERCGPGVVSVALGRGAVASEVYEASTIVAATNVPDVLDIAQVRSGTLIVDDSAPHAFNVGATLFRIKQTSDILCTEGGLLRLPDPIAELAYEPEPESPFAKFKNFRCNARDIMGCIFAALLHARFSDEADCGLNPDATLRTHYEWLLQHGVSSPSPSLEGIPIDLAGPLVCPRTTHRRDVS